MRSCTTRIVGIVFVFAAVSGILFSLYLLVEVWRVKDGVETSLRQNLDLISTTLSTTSNGLILLEDTVNSASVNASSLQTATIQLAQSIDQSRPIVQTLNHFLGTQLPQTISSTQTSLHSAETSALFIDDFLSAIAKIPLLGLGRYSPQVPLHQSLAEVSKSLNGLSPSLEELQSSLSTADQNLSIMETNVISISNDIYQVNQNLASTHQVITEYKKVTAIYQDEVKKALAGLHDWITTLAWFFTFLLVWLAVGQFSLLLEGLELLGYVPLHTHDNQEPVPKQVE